MTVVRTLFFYLCFIIAAVVALIPCFFLSLLPASARYDNKAYFFFMYLFYRISLFGTLLPITIIGNENISDDGSIVVANHQSALDVALIGALLKYKPHLWLFKKELRKIPFYGIMANRMNIAVDRDSPRKSLASLLEGIRLIRGTSRTLIIFPEGGRYADGKIHEFLWGFAIIARKTGFPVTPIVIKDAYKVYPAGSFFMNYHPVTVIIGKPFVLQADESDEQFIQRIYTWFVDQEG